MMRTPIIPEHHSFVKKIARSLRHDCHIGTGDTLAVAVSGGADSVALLRALAILAPRRRWRLRLHVVHVQHHLREQAEADAQFVAALAAGLDLPHARVDVDPQRDAGNLEAAARRARYRALADAAAATGAAAVVTAHHADDQIETLLMRLLRGTSIRGMRGIVPRRPLRTQRDRLVHLIRPMLHVTREQVLVFLRDLDQPWRDDHTNADVSRTRARLRRDVLPHLHDLDPALADHINRFASHADDLHRWVRRTIDEHAATYASCVLPRGVAARWPRPVLLGVLRRLLAGSARQADALGGKALAPLARAIIDGRGGTRTFHFARGARATLTRDTITLSPQRGG